jgi:glycosyltransferase involved in cell wall biosynthesis
LIWHLHDIIDPSHFADGQRRLQIGIANKLARMVIAPSHAVGKSFVAAGGRSSLVRVIPNGVKVVADEKPKEVLRKEKLLPQGPLVGVFSRLAPWKGQHVAVRALAQLPKVQAIFVGGSPFSADSYEIGLKRQVTELGLGNRVQFLGHRSDVHSLMQAVDVMVHPSVSPEPFALTILEAMSIGTPVIATDTGGSSEALDGGKAGVLVAPGDCKELAAAIREVLAENGQGARVLAARARAQQHYAVERMRADVGHAIQDVLAR